MVVYNGRTTFCYYRRARLGVIQLELDFVLGKWVPVELIQRFVFSGVEADWWLFFLFKQMTIEAGDKHNHTC